VKLRRHLLAMGAAVAAALAATHFVHAADVRRGEQIYGMHCASCHGATGVPTMPGAPDLKRGTALLRPDTQLLASVKRGRGAMPGYFGILNDAQIVDAIAYMRTLR
jgi:cytochrome c6